MFPKTALSTAFILFASYPCSATAQTSTLSTLYTFTGNSDGGIPSAAPLISDNAGNLYGSTIKGGDSTCSGGCGVIFKLSPSGFETPLYAFTGATGEIPNGVNADGKGDLYGTTIGGGAYNTGVVFKVNASGADTTLHNFEHIANGYQPEAGLVEDAAGNLYGTAFHGGGTGSSYGVVFRITQTGVYTVLHTFEGFPTDGAYPDSDLLMDSTGYLYGTTVGGGAGNNGTVYKMDKTGKVTLLHSFASSGADGQSPQSGLIMDSAGNLYGVTPQGGSSSAGVVFKINAAGSFGTLYNFTGGADGSEPLGKLGFIQSSGFVAGTAVYGGNQNGTCTERGGCGVVFAVSPTSGKELVLYSFTGLADGANPQSGILARTGAGGDYELFGSTVAGGAPTGCFTYPTGCGTVFKLSVTPE